MAAYRLRAPLHPDAVVGRPVSFLHDGTQVEGRDTEPVAVSLLAAGRPILSRSFRFHRPRGLMCSTGQCGWCECRVDGRPGVRSCTVLAAAGTDVRSEHAWPNASRDVLGMLDIGSRWIPNTFYHHRFLRPRLLRKLYLDVLRRFGGRGRLTAGGSGPVHAHRTTRRTVDVAVVGGGPAGLLAAAGAAQAGASVLLLEALDGLGGSWRWRTGRLPTGESLAALVDALRDGNVHVALGATAIAMYDGVLTAIAPEHHLEIRARAVVTATGGHESVPRVPNNDRPGVMGARTVEWLINAHGVVPGRRAVVLAGGPDAEVAADLLRRAGAVIAAEGVELVAIGGRGRVESATVSRSGAQWRVRADLVVFDRRSPNLDLVLGCGAELVTDSAGDLVPRLDGDGWTTVPGLAAAGACAGRPIVDGGAVDVAVATGRAAARAEARQAVALGGAAPAPPWPARSGTAEKLDGESFVCFCEDVRAREIAAELRSGPIDPEVLKRRTAVLTGPCQGKYCLDAFVDTVAATVAPEAAWRMPTARPPVRPVRLAELVADGAGEPAE